MARWKLAAFGALSGLGLLALIRYAAFVAPKGKNAYEVGLAVFGAAATGFGWIGIWISWATYRFEAGKVPRPDVRILHDGTLTKTLSVAIDLSEPRTDFSADLAERRRLLEAGIPSPGYERPATSPSFLPVGGIWERRITQEDVEKYRGEIDRYLQELERYWREAAAYDSFWKQTARLVLAFTNDKAGVPAEGVRVALQITDDDGLRVISSEKIKEMGKPEPPKAPTPPSPRSMLDPAIPMMNLDLFKSLAKQQVFPVPRPKANVSAPKIERGNSVTVSYTIGEILHNTRETTEDEPVFFFFEKSGTWTIDYELHARNLVQPRTGKLLIEANTQEQSIRKEEP